MLNTSTPGLCAPAPDKERSIEELGSALVEAISKKVVTDSLPSYEKLVAAGQRSLSWLSSYPGGGALNVYDEMRAALPGEWPIDLVSDKERPVDKGATVEDQKDYELALAFASLECFELKAGKRERHQCPGIVNLTKYVSTP